MKITIEIAPEEVVDFLSKVQEKGLETFLRSVHKNNPNQPQNNIWQQPNIMPCGDPILWWDNIYGTSKE